MCLCVFFSYAEIKFAGLNDKTFRTNVEMPDLVVQFSIKHIIFINCEKSSQMNII